MTVTTARPTATHRVVRGTLAGAAVLFGVATLVAGGRVLLGADPGYVVYRPLLIFNVVMGVPYVLTGVALWRRVHVGTMAAGAITLLNLAVLLALLVRARGDGGIAAESLGAMTFRTLAWGALAAAGRWLAHRLGAR